MAKKIVGIVGSYRKGGVTDMLVTEVLSAAEERGVETEKVYLTDQNILFCTNCRECTQEPGPEPGACPLEDDFVDLLAKCRAADGLVIGSPVNFFNITAAARQFMERMVCCVYWPWGQASPKPRAKPTSRRAVLISSSAMPGPIGRIFTGAMRALKLIAKTLEAKPVATLFVGLVAMKESPTLSQGTMKKAHRAGQKLADSI